MKMFTIEQILKIHSNLIEETGGTDGLRDKALLESAIAAPFASYAGVELFPTIEEKAARLGYGIISNHPFIDGNKRIGIHLMLLFLLVNGIVLEYEQKELVDLTLGIAEGTVKIKNVIDWIYDKAVD